VISPPTISDHASVAGSFTVRARRVGPIVTSDMFLKERHGRNINGPSIIKVPPWVENPLGAYYLYFAHHRGKYIRLAYANDITGPWSIYERGALHLKECPALEHHIASPDVCVDEINRRIVMYFHGRSVLDQGIQRTFLALSDDGRNFRLLETILGPLYSRHFMHDGFHYMLMGSGRFKLYRSPDWLSGWEGGPRVTPDRSGDLPDYRHCAVLKRGNRLLVFYTRRGDAPERILVGSVDLSADWNSWRLVGEQLVLKPETDYEGAALPVCPSRPGRAKVRENALRDPAIYEEDGRVWLTYAFAGENGLALAELHIEDK
jgi:hypothetical protein